MKELSPLSPAEMIRANIGTAMLAKIRDKTLKIDDLDNDGITGIMQSARDRKIMITKQLLKYKPNLELVDDVNMTALMHAVYGGEIAIIRMLLEKGADINHKKPNKEGVMNIALYNMVSVEIFVLLLSYKPDLGDDIYKLVSKKYKIYLSELNKYIKRNRVGKYADLLR